MAAVNAKAEALAYLRSKSKTFMPTMKMIQSSAALWMEGEKAGVPIGDTCLVVTGQLVVLRVGLLLGEPLVFQDVDRGGEGFASYGEADHVGAGFEERADRGATAEAASAEASAAGGEGDQRGLFG